MKPRKIQPWIIIKYPEDIALYAKCSCGFQYAASQNKRNIDGTVNFEQKIDKLYNYCPNCGLKKVKY